MNYKDYILFKTLYEEKNITHAAKRLFISQPAVSDRLKKIEAEFGCRLIIRETRGIQFTPQGETLYQYCLDALKQYDLVKNNLAMQDHGIQGHLNLAVSNIFARYFMPKLLLEFTQLHPNIDISMSSGYSHGLYHSFLEGNFPIAITRGTHNWLEHKVSIWNEPLGFFNATPLQVQDLRHHPYISYKTDPIFQHEIDEWWFSTFASTPRKILEVDNIETCMKLVQEGLGFTLLSHSCIINYPTLYFEPIITAAGEPLMRETFMYYRNNYRDLTHVKAFVDFMLSKAPLPSHL